MEQKNEVKRAIVICVATLVCTCVICNSILTCSDVVTDVIKNAPVKTNTATVASYYTNNTTVPTSSSAVASDNNTLDDDNVYANDITTSDAELNPTKVTADGKITTAQIIEKFNIASNKIKSSSKSITQNYCRNSQISTPEINNETIRSIADSLISSNTGYDKKKENAVYNSAEDKNKNYPVSGQNYTSKLTENDVKSASISKSGNTSTIILNIKDDPTPNIGTHATKCFSVVTKKHIIENAGSLGMKFIIEDSIGVSYANGVIKVKIDETTGNIISANYYIEWKLSLSTTIGNLDVGISFSTEEDYTIKW